MHEINVFLGLPGQPIFVRENPAAAHTGDEVLWHFHSVDPNVKWAEIEFQNNNAKFFECRSGPPSTKCEATIDGGHGHILGTAPQLGARMTRSDKYTVRSYKGQGGALVAELDPTIVTCEP